MIVVAKKNQNWLLGVLGEKDNLKQVAGCKLYFGWSEVQSGRITAVAGCSVACFGTRQGFNQGWVPVLLID